MTDADISMHFLLERALLDFSMINRREGLTEAYKNRLKESYLQNYLEPEARRLLQQKLADQKAREERRNRRFHRTNSHKT